MSDSWCAYESFIAYWIMDDVAVGKQDETGASRNLLWT